MVCGAVAFPLIGGALIGHESVRFLEKGDPKEGTVFGALWMTTAMIIAHRSVEMQEQYEPDQWVVKHAIGIMSYVLALLSGRGWFSLLNDICGFTLSEKVGLSLSIGALLSAKKTYFLYFTPKE
ncbi:MAG: hypothetical protein H7A38_04860 [Chlamydiales bacterium]|nr:hypothetical protein [Chlamydiales bacterium]